EITPGAQGTSFANFIEVRFLNFFEILDDQTGLDQLWRTDGTTNGTALVTDLKSDIAKNHFPIQIANRNGQLAVLHFRSNTGHKSYASLMFDPDTLDVTSGPKSNSIFLVDGTLRIFGSVKNDDIRVSRLSDEASMLVATLNGTSKTFFAN